MASGPGPSRPRAPWLPAVLLAAALPPAAAAQSAGGDFVHHERRTAEGEDQSLVTTRSPDGLLMLAWRCTPTGLRTMVALGWRWVGNADDDVIVHYRFPADSAATETLWRLGSTGTVAWMRIGDIQPFTDAALAADSVRMTLSDPFDGETRETAFGLAGLDAALDRLECELRRPSGPSG